MDKTLKYFGKHLSVYEQIREIHGRDTPLEFISRPNIVICIAITGDDEVAFVRQHRVATGLKVLELPAGKLKSGEDPEVATLRELREETGLIGTDVSLVHKFYTAPHFSDEFAHLYKATIAGSGPPAPTDEEEITDSFLLTFSQIRSAIDRGELTDPKSIASLLSYERISGKRILNEK